MAKYVECVKCLYDTYPFTEYSDSMNATFYFPCKLFTAGYAETTFAQVTVDGGLMLRLDSLLCWKDISNCR